jgi:4-aminobutyrate aminotransferase/(S)-3-amino-2-methylpropionate transaminase
MEIIFKDGTMEATNNWRARHTAAVPRGVGTAMSFYADRAENAEMWDVEGRRYIDFAGGIGVLNVGHRHPKVMAAVAHQMERFTHTAFQVAAYDSYIMLAEKLNSRAPFSGPAKTIFFTTGAEATENAVKIARCATGRPGVIAFAGGFHGRTVMASALTGKVAPYKRGFGGAQPDIYHVPFPVENSSITLQDTMRAIDFLFAADIEPERVAAIIIEPVQGEGGFHVASPELMRALRDLCDRHGILLIADEVQSGFARTGALFAVEHSGVEPDLVTTAKSLAGGFPLSGVIGRAEIMDKVEPGGLGGTYAGSPVACAAALAVLDVIDEERLLDRAHSVGKMLWDRLSGWGARKDLAATGNVRGLGAMIAFDVFADSDRTIPSGVAAKAVCQRAEQHGLILLTCGTTGGTIRILVPLTASDALISEGIDAIEAALALPA